MIADRRVLRRAAALTLAATIGLSAAGAGAQTDEERAGARAAAQQGAQAFQEKRWADAIDLFTRAQELVDAPPHLLYIARAHEKLGQLVKAREAYLKIKRADVGPKSPKAFRDAKAAAEKELPEVEKRLPYVSVVVQGDGADDVRVTMDGSRVPDALIGVPRPVDPGKHTFQAFATDMKSSAKDITVEEGAKETIVLTLQPAPGEKGAGAAADDTGGSDSGTKDDGTTGGEISTDDLKGNDTLRLASYVSFGVGAVGLGVGTIFLLQKGSKEGDADDLFDSCNPGCSTAQQNEIISLDDEASSAGTNSTVGFVVGGLGVVGGVVLFLMSSGDSGEKAANESSPPKPTVTPFVGYRSAGVFGTF